MEKGESIQFVDQVLNYSSEYGNSASRAYTIANIIGEPMLYPNYGDFTSSMVLRTYGEWWSRAPMATQPFGIPHEGVESQDFLEVLYPKQVYPSEVRFFETFNPGCVVRIYACNRDLKGNFKTGEIKWTLLWQGPPQSKQCPAESRIFSPQIRKIDFPTNLLRIEFDCRLSDYYTELEAVALVGRETSEKHNFLDRAVGFKIESTTKLLKQVSTVEKSGKTEEKVTPSAANTEDCDYLSLLPNETISKILSYLGLRDLCSIASTNTHFLYLAYDPVFYREIDLQPKWVSLDDIALRSLQLRAQNLIKASFSWTGAGGQISEEVFHQFITECGGSLEVLRLGCCRFITSETIKLISEKCSNLTELDLQACIHLTSEAFLPIKSLVKLQKLNLYRCAITDEVLIQILEKCGEMEHLNLGATRMESMNSVAVQLSKTCLKLKAVDLWRSNLSQTGLLALSECKELVEIDLGWSYVLREVSTIDHFVRSCKKLKKIFLTSCRESDPSLIHSMAANLPDLEQLDLLGSPALTVECIELLFKKCKKLKLIDISFCHHFTTEVVDTLRKSYTHIDIKRSFQD